MSEPCQIASSDNVGCESYSHLVTGPKYVLEQNRESRKMKLETPTGSQGTIYYKIERLKEI